MIGARCGLKIYAVSLSHLLNGLLTNLAGDISSLSPLRFLGRYTKSVPRTQVLSLSKRIWTKARYIPKVPKPNDELDFESPLPSYAHQCTTQFVDGRFQLHFTCQTMPRSFANTVVQHFFRIVMSKSTPNLLSPHEPTDPHPGVLCLSRDDMLKT